MSIATRTDSALARIAIVTRKEIADLFRDRRTMIVTVITAMAAGPLLMLLVMNLIAGQASKARELRLPIVGAIHAPALVAFLQRQQVTVLNPPVDYEEKIKGGDLDIVLEIDAEFEASVTKGEPGVIHLIYDRSRDRALPSISELERLLHSYNREWGGGRLLLRGIGAAVANPLSVEVRDLSTPQSSGALVLFLIAYYGLFATVMGGMAAAVDTTAGEREPGAPANHSRATTGTRRRQMGVSSRTQREHSNTNTLGLLPDTALRATAGSGHPLPLWTQRAG